MKKNSQSTNQQEETIKQVWNYLHKEGDPVIELRGIHPTASSARVQHFRHSNYSSFAELKAAFEEEALTLNNQNVGLARPFISYKIADGTFPSPIKLSKRASGWSATEIDAWIQERIALRGGQHDRS